MPKLFIFDAFTLLIREKTVANYALLRCKTFSLKIWVCKIFDKFHVWLCAFGQVDPTMWTLKWLTSPSVWFPQLVNAQIQICEQQSHQHGS